MVTTLSFLLNFFSYEFWLNYALVASKSLALSLGFIPNTVSLHRNKTSLLISGSLGNGVYLDTWASWKPGSLFSHVATALLFLVSRSSALGIVPPLFDANSSLHPAGPHSTAGSGWPMFLCQTKSSISNTAGPVFLTLVSGWSQIYADKLEIWVWANRVWGDIGGWNTHFAMHGHKMDNILSSKGNPFLSFFSSLFLFPLAEKQG